jgi:hypothetical protein
MISTACNGAGARNVRKRQQRNRDFMRKGLEKKEFQFYNSTAGIRRQPGKPDEIVAFQPWARPVVP